MCLWNRSTVILRIRECLLSAFVAFNLTFQCSPSDLFTLTFDLLRISNVVVFDFLQYFSSTQRSLLQASLLPSTCGCLAAGIHHHLSTQPGRGAVTWSDNVQGTGPVRGGPAWPPLVRSEQVRSDLSGPVRAGLDRAGPAWPPLVRSEQARPDLLWSGPSRPGLQLQLSGVLKGSTYILILTMTIS